ncbi:MAG: hypothetical protein ACR2PM_12435, partial [Hyphomicrobiales bacterium]
FCFSADALAGQARVFLSGFPGEVTYAVKANPSPGIIDVLSRQGVTAFDVASPAEMALVRSEAPRAGLHYHNPVKSRQEIEQAYHRFGIRHFAADDEAELHKLASTIADRGSVEAVIRFRAGQNRAGHDFSTKFGAEPAHAAALLKLAHELGFRLALTFHPGSQCLDARSYVENIEAAGDICGRANVGIGRLNVGGGFPVAYPGETVPPLSAFFSAIAEATVRVFGQEHPTLVAEPGRALVAGSTSLLARVKHRRPHIDDLFLNDGIYGAFMELTQAPVDLPCRAVRNGRVLEGPKQGFAVYGPTCDPLDRLPNPIVLPAAVTEGDWIEFGMVGAYGAATVTRFNGYGAISSVPVQRVIA